MWKLTSLVLVLYLESAISDDKLNIVDLTYALNSSTIYWPGAPEFNFTILSRGQETNFWYESNYFATAEHGGTHLDSPAHFAKGKWRVHEIPVENLIGPGVVVNVTSQATLDPDYRLQMADLESWETKYGRIPNNAIVLMKSGWSTRVRDRTVIFNTNATSDSTTFHFPGFHEDAVEWLIINRNINFIGVDTPSTDYGQSKTFPVHSVLGAHNVPSLENVGFLENIPEKGATIIVGVIKLFDGSGGPARVIATFPSDAWTSSGLTTTQGFATLGLFLCSILLVNYLHRNYLW